MKSIYRAAGAFPFLLAVFLNAFVDLGHKIVIQNTIFKIYDGKEQVILTAIVNALILLPFILLFSPAGHASDRYPKHHVMKLSAWAAVFLTCGIVLCYAMGWFWVSFAMTFMLAAQSAFYSPAKFGYIRGFFGKEHLAQANGVVSAISILAILSGTLVFSILFESMLPSEPQSEAEILRALVPIAVILVINSIVEVVMMYRVPQTDYPVPTEKFDIGRYLRGGLIKENLRPILQRDVIRLSIIGLAMFWSIGQVLLSSFPDFAETQTGEKNTIVIQAILAATGLGIALGSLIASKRSKNYIETGLIPVGAGGIALGLWLLPHLTSQLFMGLNFLFIGIMGGLFIVPLNAMIQFYASENELGKVLAGNNLIQNIAMFSVLVITVIFAYMGISSKQLLMLTALLALVGGVYTVLKLPQSLVRFILASLMSRRYRVDVQGMKNIPSSGGVLLLGNHLSWIDWAIVQIACPRPVQFVMLKSIYERWYLTWFFKLFGCVPIEQGVSSKNSLDIVSGLLNAGKVVCLFPEGAISRTGHLGEFRHGYMRATKACEPSTVIVPFYLRGLWGSQFSRSSEKLKSQSSSGWKRDIVVAFGVPLNKDTPADSLKRSVFDLSISSWQLHAKGLPTLACAFIDTAKRQAGEMAIAENSGESLSATRLLAAVIIFSKRINIISPEQNIGLLLPTSTGGAVANMATLMLGKTLVNLNYTASYAAIAAALKEADISTVYSSRAFMSKLVARGIELNDVLAGTKVVMLEDIRAEVSKVEFIATIATIKLLPAFALKFLFCRHQHKKNTAAILFSSGSEGNPKGVMLSHTNFMANLKQISDVLNMDDKDVMMSSLPLFHAFGLTVSQFLPLIEGLPMICHPDPTDAVGIGKAVARYRATIMCGTSTFLRLYARSDKVHPLMLDSLRLVISGAEKLNPEVREQFKAKFNKDILEGYGATETTPVASVNLPDSLDINYWKVQLGGKLGTVGMPLPGTSFKIVDPDSYEELNTGEEGMVLIGGAQVMQGYLHDQEKTDQVIKVIDSNRWYVTGDKGRLDEDGFLSIVDRYSRFAKIGGEMISLSAVEAVVRRSVLGLNDPSLEDFEAVAVSLNDDKKGEKIILLTEHDISLSEIKAAMLAHACLPLMLPSNVILVKNLPKLGSGKTDFSLVKQIALA